MAMDTVNFDLNKNQAKDLPDLPDGSSPVRVELVGSGEQELSLGGGGGSVGKAKKVSFQTVHAEHSSSNDESVGEDLVSGAWCGHVAADRGAGSQHLPTLREEEETGSEGYSEDNCSVLSSSIDSLNASTEHLLLSAAYPEEFKSLPSSELTAVHDKMSRLDGVSLRCANCLSKFPWAGDSDPTLYDHINTCWRKNDEEVDPDLAALVKQDKNVTRSEYAEIRDLASALLEMEWEHKQRRCVPVCERGRCADHREKNVDTTIDSSEPEHPHLSDMESSVEEEVAAAEQRMLVYLVQAKESVWHNKMAAVIGLPLHATVDDLDSSLRRLWVECCGHSSSLSVGGQEFEFPDIQGGMDQLSIGEKGKCEAVERELRNIFTETGECGTYLYDPRNPTILRVTFLDCMDLTLTLDAEFPAHSDFYLRGPDMLRSSTRKPIAATILLRNSRPEVVCIECQENYALLLDNSNIDYHTARNVKLSAVDPHAGLFLPVGFCSLDCVAAFNEEMSLLPENEGSMRIDRTCLVMTSNSPRTGTCCYGHVELDSSINTATSSQDTDDTGTTMDTSCSCPDCDHSYELDCSTCDSWSATDPDTDREHSYAVKDERSPGYHVKKLVGGGHSGTPILTRYVKRNSASESPCHSRV